MCSACGDRREGPKSRCGLARAHHRDSGSASASLLRSAPARRQLRIEMGVVGDVEEKKGKGGLGYEKPEGKKKKEKGATAALKERGFEATASGAVMARARLHQAGSWRRTGWLRERHHGARTANDQCTVQARRPLQMAGAGRDAETMPARLKRARTGRAGRAVV